MKAQRHKSMACPCGRPLSYQDCCAPFHAGMPAPDAETLMRSRYAAYALGVTGYLLATWHSSTRPTEIGASPKWIGLEVMRHEITGSATACVEFVARYKDGGRACRLHETSRFVREAGRWYYLDGDFAP